jgi:hypothetical protein
MWGAQVCSLSAMSGNYCLQKDSLYAIEAVRSITKIPIKKKKKKKKKKKNM